MRRRIGALGVACALAIGCGPADPCETAGAAASCLSIHVRGSVAQADQLVFDLRGAVETRFTRKLPAKTDQVFAAVAIALGTAAPGPVKVRVMALLDTATHGLGSVDVSIAASGRQRAEVVLQAVPAATCSDSFPDGNETDIDCGGESCVDRCGLDKRCLAGPDCASGVCATDTHRCAMPSCTDRVKNGSETDVDCGGSCNACAVGQSCAGDKDCKSLSCVKLKCADPTCSDMKKNGTETDTDCGGVDLGCPRCGLGKHCFSNTDCEMALKCNNTICS